MVSIGTYVRNLKRAIVNFGNGTVKIKRYKFPKRSSLELSTCHKTDIGNDKPNKRRGSPSVYLNFSCVESIDVLIEQLVLLKEEFKESKNE